MHLQPGCAGRVISTRYFQWRFKVIAVDYVYQRWSTNRDPHRAYTQPEGRGYLVGTVCRGRSTL